LKHRIRITAQIVLLILGAPAWASEVCGGIEGMTHPGTEARAAYQEGLQRLVDVDGGQSTNPEQAEIARTKAVELLGFASDHGCARAMVELARIRLFQAGAYAMCQSSASCRQRGAVVDEPASPYESQALELLERGVQLGEGYFELGLLLTTPSSQHYSMKRGMDLIKMAKDRGDERAEQFIQLQQQRAAPAQ
jgi:hypothetical protein